MRTALLQQQQRVRSVLPPVLLGNPWLWWTPQDIAIATNSPEWAVTEDWPKVYSALLTWGIADYDTSRAVLATIAIETAHTFKPVQEAFWLDDAWRYANLRYAPYWGRGYVQLTWLENYTYYGWKIGHPELATFPDKAMVPDHSCTAIGCVLQRKGHTARSTTAKLARVQTIGAGCLRWPA
jgi:hypothetical protein